MKPKILFDKKSIPFILEAIGCKVGRLGEALNADNNPILDVDGKPFMAENLIGIIDGYFITRESQLIYLSELKLKEKISKII